MQCDDVVWGILRNHHCSFKSTVSKDQHFCRNQYNATGLCNRVSCPLANSRYATIREEKGTCFLYIKTIERAHSPKNLWEKIQLERNYSKALDQVSEHLKYFPKYLNHKNKQRLTKIHQYLIRMRKLKLKAKPKLVAIDKKIDRRDAKREAKAERAANLEKSIANELLGRLKRGTYGDIYNFPEVQYGKALELAENEYESEEEVEAEENQKIIRPIEYVEGIEEESDLEDGNWATESWNAGLSNSDLSSDEEEETSGRKKRKENGSTSPENTKKTKAKQSGIKSNRPYVEIEYEDEMEGGVKESNMSFNW